MSVYESVLNDLRAAIEKLKSSQPPSREKSLAITHTETAILWVLTAKGDVRP